MKGCSLSKMLTIQSIAFKLLIHIPSLTQVYSPNIKNVKDFFLIYKGHVYIERYKIQILKYEYLFYVIQTNF